MKIIVRSFVVASLLPRKSPALMQRHLRRSDSKGCQDERDANAEVPPNDPGACGMGTTW